MSIASPISSGCVYSTNLIGIKARCLQSYDRGEEACGFVLKDKTIIALDNIAASQGLDPSTDFVIAPSEYRRYEPVLSAIYHSHINGNHRFTPADVKLCKETNKPLILYDVIRNEFHTIDPRGKTPLLGRDFVYGIYDCFSLVRDYYSQKLNIELPDFPRLDCGLADNLIWLSEDWDIIDANVHKWGFVQVSEPEHGDIIGMSFGRNTHVNHLAVYTGHDRFIHQLINRKSCEEVWGVPWVDYTVKFWRFLGRL